jgi:hypothetical protein
MKSKNYNEIFQLYFDILRHVESSNNYKLYNKILSDIKKSIINIFENDNLNNEEKINIKNIIINQLELTLSTIKTFHENDTKIFLKWTKELKI